MFQILVAEDDKNTRRLMEAVLKEHGYHPILACDGLEALKLLDTHHVDLVILDIMMPGMDGYEATRTIRSGANPLGRTIPIIAMTANAFAEDVKKSLDAGMNAHLSKPVDLNALEQTLQRFRYEPSVEQPQ